MASNTAQDRPTRTRMTPQQKAQKALDKANSDNEKAQRRFTKAQEELAAAQAEVDRAASYVNYASQNPDLSPVQSDAAGTNAAE